MGDNPVIVRCEVLTGDCVVALAGMAEASVDAIVTDPPYGLEFMGKDWDRLGAWRAGGGFSKPGLGERPTPWASYGGGDTANATCATCGGRMRGATKCKCDEPDWRVKGEPLAAGVDSRQVQSRRMQAWHEAWAREALRVLKPGGHLLAFGGTRTYHRLACALEDAGFELRDEIMWLYGSGFPKSLDVAKAIDKAARGVPQGGSDPTSANHGRFKTQATEGSRGDGDVGRGYGAGPGQFMAEAGERADRELVAEAQPWDGWGTALKPAHEPIVVARKPLAGTVAANVLEHGTGAINVDGCRVGTSKDVPASPRRAPQGPAYGELGNDPGTGGGFDPNTGRWPANVVLSHDEDCVLVGRREVRANSQDSDRAPGPAGIFEGRWKPKAGAGHGVDGYELVEMWACVPGCPVRMLDDQTGALAVNGPARYASDSESVLYGDGMGARRAGDVRAGFGDRGGASRFFYCAKASRAERNAGLEDGRNSHPTVKPIDLMRWLVRLVTPPGGVVLDPFVGSGTTGCAAVLEGFGFVGVERDAEYSAIAEARIRFWREHPTGLPVEVALEAEARRRRVQESGQLGLGFGD